MIHSYGENDELYRLDEQIAFTSAYIVALGLNIYAIGTYKDSLINKKNFKINQKKIKKSALLASSIALIVTIYFFITTYQDYENNPVTGLFDFYTAATLSFVAQSIRFNALIKYPNDIVGIEDIV